MKFSLRYMLLEITLIAIFLGISRYRPMWNGPEDFTLHTVEMVVVMTLWVVSLCAAIGGLFHRPGRGAIGGLILSLILTPMAILGSMY